MIENSKSLLELFDNEGLSPDCSSSKPTNSTMGRTTQSEGVSLLEETPTISKGSSVRELRRCLYASLIWGEVDWDAVSEKYEKWKSEKLKLSYLVHQEGFEPEIRFFLAKKRGTEAYTKMIRGKIYNQIRTALQSSKNLNMYKFLTLTIPQNGYESYQIIRKEWNRFLTLLKYHYPNVRVLRVFELQKRGSVHVHVLLSGVTYISKKWINKNWNGLTWIEKPRSIGGIFYYITKYMTKLNATDSVVFWLYGSRQWSSNFPCPYKTNSKKDETVQYFFIGCVVTNLDKIGLWAFSKLLGMAESWIDSDFDSLSKRFSYALLEVNSKTFERRYNYS